MLSTGLSGEVRLLARLAAASVIYFTKFCPSISNTGPICPTNIFCQCYFRFILIYKYTYILNVIFLSGLNYCFNICLPHRNFNIYLFHLKVYFLSSCFLPVNLLLLRLYLCFVFLNKSHMVLIFTLSRN